MISSKKHSPFFIKVLLKLWDPFEIQTSRRLLANPFLLRLMIIFLKSYPLLSWKTKIYINLIDPTKFPFLFSLTSKTSIWTKVRIEFSLSMLGFNFLNFFTSMRDLYFLNPYLLHFTVLLLFLSFFLDLETSNMIFGSKHVHHIS